MSVKSIKMNQENFGTLAVCAIRYCQGRQTYMPSLIQSILKPHLHELSDKDLGVMIDDCEFQDRMNLYGSDTIDKPSWIAWKEALLEERKSRVTEYTKEKCKHKEPVSDKIDKIRTEIKQLPTKTRTNWNGCCPDIDYPEIEYVDVTKDNLLKIIDKYID